MSKIVHISLTGSYTEKFNYHENMMPKYHKQMGHNVTLIATQWSRNKEGKIVENKESDYMNEYGVKVIRLAQNRKKPSLSAKFKKYPKLMDVLINENADIIYLHNIQFLDVAIVEKYVKNNPTVKLYVDSHADGSNSGSSWISKNILHKVIWKRKAKSLERYAEKFYGVLPARVSWLMDMYGLPKEKCELLVMGADDEQVEAVEKSNMRSVIREKHSVTDNDFLIVTGGKIDAFKIQTLYLMEAVKNIDNKNVKLLVFGSVTPELIEKVEALSDGNKIMYIGWITANDSYYYFAASDLVVFPGRHSVFWEQVAGQGIPMVVKYWPGTTHVNVGGNVKFLEEDSAEEIQEIVEKLLSEPFEYEKMKEIAVNEGKNMFSYRDIAKRAIEFSEERK